MKWLRALLLGVVNAAAPNSGYVKISGIGGTSTDQEHPAEIIVTSFSWNASNAFEAGGGGVFTVDVSPIRFTKPVDIASPPLLLYVVNGIPIADPVVFTFTDSNGRTIQTVQLLNSSRVTSVQQRIVPGSPLSTEDVVTMAASRVTMTDFAYKSDGSRGSTTSLCYDTATATVC